MFGLISDMSTHNNLSCELEYDEYVDNETAVLEARALQNGEESKDECEDDDDGSSSSDGSRSSSDDESSESSEHLDTGDRKSKAKSKEKIVRALTRLKKLKKNWNGQKHVIEFDKLGHFKGEYKSEIASYMGVIVRRDVGLRHLNWKKVRTELRDKARKSLIVEKSFMPEAPVRSNYPIERQESNSNSQSQSGASKDKSELRMTGKFKQTSLPSEHQSLNSREESQSKGQTELSMIGKCKLANATLRNIIAKGTIFPSTPNQLVHGDPLEDDCVKVLVDEAILPNHSLPIQSAHLKTVRDAVNSFVAWPKEFVICCSTNQPLSDPDEHDSDPNTKKKKKPSTKSGELKSQRSSKRLKTAT